MNRDILVSFLLGMLLVWFYNRCFKHEAKENFVIKMGGEGNGIVLSDNDLAMFLNGLFEITDEQLTPEDLASLMRIFKRSFISNLNDGIDSIESLIQKRSNAKTLLQEYEMLDNSGNLVPKPSSEMILKITNKLLMKKYTKQELFKEIAKHTTIIVTFFMQEQL